MEELILNGKCLYTPGGAAREYAAVGCNGYLHYFGLGTAAMLGLSWMLYQNGTLPLSMFIGMLLFVFELFAPLKAFYGQVARLSVMSACLDRVESVFDENELDNSGTASV